VSIYVEPKRIAAPAAAVEPYKAGPLGPGAGVLLTEFPLQSGGRVTPQRKMRSAWNLSFAVPWIAAAEDAINERFSGAQWHLEDDEDVEIDDEYPNADAQQARQLIEYPSRNVSKGAPYYRTDLWSITSRAMGICGSAFILLDAPELLGGTPDALYPIAPWRMDTNEDAQGNLVSWQVDRSANSPGTELSLEQVLHFQLRRDFTSKFGIGLVESAMKKSGISQQLDDHVGMVLSAGGRLSGILSPQQGVIDPDTLVAMERDWRTVVEQADAAKRLQLVRAPVRFDRTTLTPQELQVRDLMDGARDDLLALWGVPLSMIGGVNATGLNSGDNRKYDEAALWQGPVHSRLTIFREVMQYGWLDRYEALGITLELEIEEPEFDDDSPRYDLLGKSLNTPMRNVERRALVGLPPLGDPTLDNQIVLPATIVPYATAPDENGEPVSVPTGSPDAVQQEQQDQAPTVASAAPAGSTPAQPMVDSPTKARLHPHIAPLHASLVRLRDTVQSRVTPILKTRVHDELARQRHEIAERMRANAEHIAKRPADSRSWMPPDATAKMTRALAPHLTVMAESVNKQIVEVLPPKPSGKAAPPGAVERVLARGVTRVQGITETTRAKVQDAITRGLDAGLSVTDVADLVEGIGSEEDAATIGLDLGSLFDEYRAEMIARTELMDAYNGAALGSYSDAGVEMVQAIDGDGDPECAERDGETFSVDDADAIEDHPNGTLDWVPVIEEDATAGAQKARDVDHLERLLKAMPVPIVNVGSPKATRTQLDYDDDGRIVGVTEEYVGDEAKAGAVDAALFTMPAPVVNISPPTVNVTLPTVNVAPAEVSMPAPVVNVTAPAPVVPPAQVNVTAAAPDVHVHTPDEIAISKMPTRRTEKRVKRSNVGAIESSEEIESDF
jgi:hypothetical protein